ncbi:glycosyltransferase family 2 protein [Kocuria sp. CPCC 205263]|uniref:glycosyltransferase family 2 protein n=1 Tax=Kocuria sp. CPCC 205263 TaxID=3073555 RepID=UPI0034D74A4B
MGGMPACQRPDRPGVSVVIPAFNEEAVIERCLLAVLDQTVAAEQIIVVDNGSTDGTGAVVTRVQRQHPESPIIVVQQNLEQGLVPTRNFGLNSATADVLGRIDADSVLAPQWVEQVQQAFLDPGVAAATGPVAYDDMPLRRLGLRLDDAGRRLALRLAPDRYPMLYGSNMAIRRCAWEEIRSTVCRDEADEMHEDLDLTLHLGEHGLRIAYVPAMVAGVSARRLDDVPEDFRYYVNRFDRTCRAHQVDSPALKAPAVMLRSLYRPLKLLRAMHPSSGPGPHTGSASLAVDRHKVTTGAHRHPGYST